MSLRPCSDPSPADWIVGSALPWGRLVSMGPAGFAAYARLRFIPDPQRPGQSENEVEAGWGMPSEHERLRVALEVLGRHTSTPDDIFYCIWDGWGWSTAGRADEVRVGVEATDELELAARSYYLLRGTLADFETWKVSGDWTRPPGQDVPDPAFVWPADRAWCVANDVDPHYAGIAASIAAITQLLETPGLDVVRADLDEDQPAYR